MDSPHGKQIGSKVWTAHRISLVSCSSMATPEHVSSSNMATTEHSHHQLSPTKMVLGSVAVVGAGMSGLAAAYRLKAEGVAVTVFEAENISGGKIKSFSEDGFVWEKGPNTMTESGVEVSRMIDGLNLRDKQQYPVMQSKRYIVRNGKPELLPSNPLTFLGSKLLSARAKFHIVFEPFLWRRRKQHDESKSLTNDESVGDFLERHVGREVVDFMVDPFIAGTSGSDPDSLSMRHAFPDFWTIEERYGSLIVGAIKSSIAKKGTNQRASKSKSRTASSGSFSFVGGMQTLTDAISEFIGQDSLRYNASVLSLACNQQGNPLRDSWKVALSQDSNESKKQANHNFDAVIMTAPVSDFQQMQVFKDGKPYSLELMPKLTYQPLSVLVMAFKKEDVKHPLDGFGVLVPSKEQTNGLQTLGTLFSSSMFPDRAPSDTMLFTSFIGGSRNRDLASKPAMELKAAAMNDLHQLVGVSGRPVFFKHVFWSRAFPQYGPGYDSVLDAFQKLEEDLPGFYYAGNHRDGLAVGKALASGYNIAGQVLEYLQSSGGSKLYTMASAKVES